MIKSMTGFGRSEIATEERKIIVEMKSVNHRFCDVNIKMPKKISFLETSIRTYLKKYIERGKVDIFITYEDFTENNETVKYNSALAAEYMKHFQSMSEQFGIVNDITPSTLGRMPDVFSLEEQSVDEDKLWEIVEKAIDEACQGFVQSRIVEGDNLKNNLLEKLANMEAAIDFIEAKAPELITEYRQKLLDKVAELLGNTTIDENRIATEVVIYADKICVDEETVRLRSHIESTRKILEDGGSVGRKLDFIAQEMNREANTILSKANSLEISNRAIELKTEIEKVREQIQNLE